MGMMVARFPGTCLNCSGRIRSGDRIYYSKGAGATHDVCPLQPELAGREFRWARLDDGGWGVRVTDPAGNCDVLQDEVVTVTNRSGRSKEVKLSQMVSARDQGDCTYACESADQQLDFLPGPDVVPAGRYAIDMGGTYFMVRVWRGRNPKYVRVYEDRTDAEVDRADALARISEAGPAEAARLYGTLTGSCSRCAKRLDVRLSVKLGIGPVCGKKFYEPADWKRIMAEARSEIRADGFDPSEPVDTVIPQAA